MDQNIEIIHLAGSINKSKHTHSDIDTNIVIILFCSVLFRRTGRCRWCWDLAMVLTFFPENFAGSMFFIMPKGPPKPSVEQCYPPFIGRSIPTSCFIAACQAPVMPAQLLCWVWECLFIYRLTEFDVELSFSLL